MQLLLPRCDRFTIIPLKSALRVSFNEYTYVTRESFTRTWQHLSQSFYSSQSFIREHLRVLTHNFSFHVLTAHGTTLARFCDIFFLSGQVS